MKFADISVKESLSTVTAVVRLTSEEQVPGTVPGAVIRRGYDSNSIRSRRRLSLLLRVGSFRLTMWFY
jgi:hypothetical protein